MIILQIIATLRIGGAEKVAKDIGTAALNAGHEVHYLVFGDNVGDYEAELTKLGAVIIHIPSPSASYKNYYQTLKRLMKENCYDVVHAHTMFSIGWAMLAAKECGVPVRIAHAHSALNDGNSVKKQIYEKTMRQLILHHATHLIACGDSAGIRLFGETAYINRGICILNGIDTKAFAFDAEKRRVIRKSHDIEDSFVLGHVGHLMEVKNQSFLIRLMPELLKRKPTVRLLMLGEGENRPMLEQLIRELNLSDAVIMTGNVRNVPDYLSAMDVFAFPSLYEGMPLSILEVQTNGLPCILSDGVPTDVHQTDLIQVLSLSHSKLWIQAICEAERADSEKYADELQRKGFDTQSVMKKFLEIYERANRQ